MKLSFKAILAGTLFGVLASTASAGDYQVEVQWGGNTAPWNQDKVWRIGVGHRPIKNISFASGNGNDKHDGAKTYAGHLNYVDHPARVTFRAVLKGEKEYFIDILDGTNTWIRQEKTWVIGGREGQPIVFLNATSSDNGATLVGETRYLNEGLIGFKATQK